MKDSSELLIVGLGDSITAATTGNWPAEDRWLNRAEAGLRALFPRRKIAAINSGVGGNTSREGLARFEKDVVAHAPAAVLIEFGGNDATMEPDRHVTPDEFVRNLAVMSARCREIGAQPFFLTFPPLVDLWHPFWPDEPFREKGGKDWTIEAYREATRRAAEGGDALMIDIDFALRVAMRRTGVASQIMPDGVHLNPGGNLTVALAVIEKLGAWIGTRC